MRSYDSWKSTEEERAWSDFEKWQSVRDDAETLLYESDDYEDADAEEEE